MHKTKNIEEIIALLSQYFSRMESEAKDRHGFKDLTITQMHYLEMISTLVNPNLTELATALKLTKPSVTVLVDKLIEKELVYKVRSDADRRNTHLHLTEQGNLINKMHSYAHQQISKEISRKIDQADLDLLIGLLNKIV